MGSLRKLAKHSSHYFLGRGCLLILGFVSFPLFTRVLTVEQFGLLNLALNLVLAGVTVSKVGMQTAVQRFHREYMDSGNLSAVRSYYSTIFFGTCATGTVTALLILAGVLLLRPLGSSNLTGSIFLLVPALILTRALQSIVMNLLQAENRTFTYISVEIATKGLTILAVCLLLFKWQRSVSAYFIGMTTVEVLAVGVVAAYVVNREILSLAAFDRGFFSTAIRFGFPLMLSEMAAVILDTGDRVLVRWYLGPTELGYYAAVYGIAAYVRELLTIPINMALLPVCMETWVTSGIKETQQLLSKSLTLFMIGGIGLIGLLALISSDLVIILASKKYQPGAPLLPILFAGLITTAVGTFFGVGLIIHKQSKVLATNTAVAALLNIVLNVLLLPRIGIMGAAIATLIGFVVQVVLTAYTSLKVLPFTIAFKSFAKAAICCAIVVALGSHVHVSNVWFDLALRTAIAGGYLGLFWAIDNEFKQSISITLNAWRSRGARKVSKANIAVLNSTD